MTAPHLDLFTHLFAPSLGLSFILCGLLVWSQRWHGHFSFDKTEGVQRMHANPVPRIGGLAIFLTLVIINNWHSASPSFQFTSILLIMGTLIFSFGFMEDITQKVSVGLRMWASLLPGFIAYFLTDEYLISLDFAWLDALVISLPIGLVFTAFAISGMTHAMNFLDGLNGLASWSALWILAGMATLAIKMGSNLELASIVLLAGATTGFLVWNWPFGKLFLGDGGAYLIGMVIAWLAIALSNHHANITAWSMLLMCAYPITETLFSIYRRAIGRKSSGEPDRAHLHQLVASVWIYRQLSSKSLVMRNSIAGFIASLINIPLVILAITLHENKWACISGYLLFGFAYVLSYQALQKRLVGLQAQLRSSSAPKIAGGE